MLENAVLFGFVTILILIDGFLQSKSSPLGMVHHTGHNPYFNRWFSAIYYSGKYHIRVEVSQSLF